MTCLIRTGLAVLALSSSAVFAQSASPCPTLPQGSGLRWDVLQGPGFLFCKALRESDGGEAFAVTLSRNSPFVARRNDRAEQASIAGQTGHWYRTEIAGDSGTIARETLVDIEGDNVAHISLRASSEEQKTQAMQQVQALRFEQVRLSASN